MRLAISLPPPDPQAVGGDFGPGLDVLQQLLQRDVPLVGCNFAYAPDQKNYRVVYHPQINEGVTPDQVSALGAPGLVDDYRTSPLEEELAIYAERPRRTRRR